MYYPIQIPYLLNQEFAHTVQYTETPPGACSGFILCFWEMKPRSNARRTITNVIATDACIDLVANLYEETIGFAGMSKTDFAFSLDLPGRYLGARLAPGAFVQLTGIPAWEAMDTFLPMEIVFSDFDRTLFFSLPFQRAADYLQAFLTEKVRGVTPDRFTALFHFLFDSAPATTRDLYRLLHFSPRQCQRIFKKHYGITPKMALSILRFQKCLQLLTSPTTSSDEIIATTGYYDQPHFINDFKRNLGITPLELIRLYQT